MKKGLFLLLSFIVASIIMPSYAYDQQTIPLISRLPSLKSSIDVVKQMYPNQFKLNQNKNDPMERVVYSTRQANVLGFQESGAHFFYTQKDRLTEIELFFNNSQRAKEVIQLILESDVFNNTIKKVRDSSQSINTAYEGSLVQMVSHQFRVCNLICVWPLKLQHAFKRERIKNGTDHHPSTFPSIDRRSTGSYPSVC